MTFSENAQLHNVTTFNNTLLNFPSELLKSCVSALTSFKVDRVCYS